LNTRTAGLKLPPGHASGSMAV